MNERSSIGKTNIARLLASVGLALVLGIMLSGHVDARNNAGKTIAQRTSIQRANCENAGGSFDVTTVKGSVTNGHQVISTTTSCTGGGMDGNVCTNTKTSTICRQAAPSTPSPRGHTVNPTHKSSNSASSPSLPSLSLFPTTVFAHSVTSGTK